MITIIDYGMGNLRSVQKAIESVGADAKVSQDLDTIQKSAKIVLPGVGAMLPAMQRLEELSLVKAIQDHIRQNKPFLGICLGFQLLFESSEEGGGVPGLNVFRGKVMKFTQGKVPHMGWNQLAIQRNDCPILKGVANDASVYFCHSFFAQTRDPGIIAATTQYTVAFPSVLWHNNCFAVQFHPEKSQDTGLRILKNFVEYPS